MGLLSSIVQRHLRGLFLALTRKGIISIFMCLNLILLFSKFGHIYDFLNLNYFYVQIKNNLDLVGLFISSVARHTLNRKFNSISCLFCFLYGLRVVLEMTVYISFILKWSICYFSLLSRKKDHLTTLRTATLFQTEAIAVFLF